MLAARCQSNNDQLAGFQTERGHSHSLNLRKSEEDGRKGGREDGGREDWGRRGKGGEERGRNKEVLPLVSYVHLRYEL